MLKGYTCAVVVADQNNEISECIENGDTRQYCGTEIEHQPVICDSIVYSQGNERKRDRHKREIDPGPQILFAGSTDH